MCAGVKGGGDASPSIAGGRQNGEGAEQALGEEG